VFFSIVVLFFEYYLFCFQLFILFFIFDFLIKKIPDAPITIETLNPILCWIDGASKAQNPKTNESNESATNPIFPFAVVTTFYLFVFVLFCFVLIFFFIGLKK